MCKQLDESLIGQCEHNITQALFLIGECNHNITHEFFLVSFTIISKGIQYYEKISIQGFPLSWSINSPGSFELVLATLL